MLHIPFCTFSLQYAFYQGAGNFMKLTIIRLQQLSDQDRIDLGKIWPGVNVNELEATLSENHRLYAARFNARLLAAVKLEIRGTQGELTRLEVREVTRRRGVGRYLVEEVMAQNPSISHWWIADKGVDDQQVFAAFMQSCGFRTQADGWVYNKE
jgi:GNAT superfamily N-acetyltransferase